jgi:hypothetical protein
MCRQTSILRFDNKQIDHKQTGIGRKEVAAVRSTKPSANGTVPEDNSRESEWITGMTRESGGKATVIVKSTDSCNHNCHVAGEFGI